MRGRSEAFTLVELLIAVVISTLVVLALSSVYRAVQDVRKRFLDYEQSRKFYELVYLIQKQLMSCRDLKLENGTLSYYTTFGISAPYVMVMLRSEDHRIYYSESNPYDRAIVYIRREWRSPYELKLSLRADGKALSLSYGANKLDLYINYNAVPTSNIFLKPF
ncbi:PulJ/GspJ family protein [Hydrogenobacter thermophilus]|uniref:PulJ/GspJ family protein n=1 Tax=Hydrogenobacter thermophilus TaxID=940 RepID=UPI0030F5CD93